MLNGATFNARNSEIIISQTGIDAVDSQIILDNVFLDTNRVGIRLTRSTLVERNVRHNNIEQNVVTDAATAVITPPVADITPSAPPISFAPTPDPVSDPNGAGPSADAPDVTESLVPPVVPDPI